MYYPLLVLQRQIFRGINFYNNKFVCQVALHSSFGTQKKKTSEICCTVFIVALVKMLLIFNRLSFKNVKRIYCVFVLVS